MFSIFFTKETVVDFDTAKTSDLQLFSSYFNGMLERGVYLAPSQYESLFVSTAIGQKEIEKIVSANRASLSDLKN
jgi:glutamate-1-semialdehyde 2,1-aminomutase